MPISPDSPGQERLQQVASLWVTVQPVVASFIGASIRDRHLAEDVLQEVARIVVVRANDYDPQAPFRPWVFGIARNCILRQLRDSARDRLVFDEQIIDLMSDTYERVSDEAAFYHDALRQCLDHLAGRGRRVVELRYVDDLKGEEIASKLGMTAVAVRVLLHRVRSSLRECVERRVTAMRRRIC